MDKTSTTKNLLSSGEEMSYYYDIYIDLMWLLSVKILSNYHISFINWQFGNCVYNLKTIHYSTNQK